MTGAALQKFLSLCFRRQRQVFRSLITGNECTCTDGFTCRYLECPCLLLIQVNRGMKFIGGESAGLSRVHEYFWKKARFFSCMRISMMFSLWKVEQRKKLAKEKNYFKKSNNGNLL